MSLEPRLLLLPDAEVSGCSFPQARKVEASLWLLNWRRNHCWVQPPRLGTP